MIKTLWHAATDSGHAATRMPAPLRPLLAGVQDILLLGVRLFVAKAFFLAGLTKIRDWETTLLLFENEYAVPLLPSQVAAYAGTAGELLLPVLLAVGLGGRFAAAGLFVLNIVAVMSLSEIAPAALMQHQLWGAMLLLVWLWGPGRLSADHPLFNRAS